MILFEVPLLGGERLGIGEVEDPSGYVPPSLFDPSGPVARAPPAEAAIVRGARPERHRTAVRVKTMS